MSSYIDAAKDQVRAIVREVKEAFLNESSVRVAVVGYKDHGDSPNIEFLDFTSSVSEVHAFLGRLEASGGSDIPEDVLGGVRQAVNASWSQQTRCLVHIADAPPHGHALHDYGEADDDYYKTASEPHGLTHENLLQRLVALKVNYALLRINSSTDRMALEFGKAYSGGASGGGGGGAGTKLHADNTHSAGPVDSLLLAKSRLPGSLAGTGPLFEEMQLGTTYSALRHLVVRTVTASVSRTANRLSLALSRSRGSAAGSAAPRKSRHPGLSAIAESATVGGSGSMRSKVKAKATSLETAPPRWDTPGWLDEELALEGFCLNVDHGADTLNAMMDSDDNIRLGVVKLALRARSRPFAEGAMRLAAYARPAATTNRFVIKSFKEPGESLADLVEDMRMQALCKAFALEFNGLAKPPQPIDFITTLCLQDKSGGGRSSKGAGNLSLEPFIAGEYVKYNSNGPYVLDDDDNPFNETAQAFSHFTFERSWGHFLVTDLQGVGNSFTDPAIQTLDPERFKLGPTNLGEEGFKFFFAMHTCNDTCRRLGLLSTKDMVMSRNFSFRETWPALDPTVCCSNKLCRKIIRLASAHKSPAYAGCNWCAVCFPQLASTKAEVPCTAPGPKHGFEVSRFYYESQGEQAPTVCEEHREKDMTVTPVVGGGLWASTKSSDAREISGRLW
jgi:hypothetical protein